MIVFRAICQDIYVVGMLLEDIVKFFLVCAGMCFSFGEFI